MNKLKSWSLCFKWQKEGITLTNLLFMSEQNLAVILDVFKHWNSVSGQHQNNTSSRHQECNKGRDTFVIKGLEPTALWEVIASVKQFSEKNWNESYPITTITGGLLIYKSKSQSACWLLMTENYRKQRQQIASRSLLCMAHGWYSACGKIHMSWTPSAPYCHHVSWSVWTAASPIASITQHPFQGTKTLTQGEFLCMKTLTHTHSPHCSRITFSFSGQPWTSEP